jgi:UrcA family protein
MSHFTTPKTSGSRAKLAMLLVGSVAGIVAAGAASAASPSNDAPSLVVKYDRQSLATDDGVNSLYRRITYAARQVCPDADIRDLAAQQHVQQCRSHAVAAAIKAIDNSQLAALYAVHSKNS